MQVRKATIDDLDDLFAWRNDATARSMFKSKDTVDYATHLAWYTRALGDPQTLVLIGQSAGSKVGVLRFERLERSWNVSINIAPDHRGSGYGYELLRKGLSVLKDTHGSCSLFAEINRNNSRSFRVFERCGFHVSETDGDFVHMRRELS